MTTALDTLAPLAPLMLLFTSSLTPPWNYVRIEEYAVITIALLFVHVNHGADLVVIVIIIVVRVGLMLMGRIVVVDIRAVALAASVPFGC